MCTADNEGDSLLLKDVVSFSSLSHLLLPDNPCYSHIVGPHSDLLCFTETPSSLATSILLADSRNSEEIQMLEDHTFNLRRHFESFTLYSDFFSDCTVKSPLLG